MRTHRSIVRGAFGRLFAFWSLLAIAGAAVAAPCAEAWPPRELRFAGVVDGDTLKLADGRSLRIAGIDTPELGRDGRPDQPYARAARDLAQAFVDAHGPTLTVRLAEDPKDGYGRLIGRVSAGDADLGLSLLRAGLALAVVVPPNDATADCHRAAETEARSAARGLWSGEGPVIEAQALGERSGFTIVRGHIERRLRAPRGGANLQLEGGLVLRIRPEDATAHPQLLEPAPGDRVQVRGWISRREDRPQLWLSHPANLERPAPVRR